MLQDVKPHARSHHYRFLAIGVTADNGLAVLPVVGRGGLAAEEVIAAVVGRVRDSQRIRVG